MRNLSEVNINTAAWRSNGQAAGRQPRKPESAEASAARKCPTATYISPPRHPSTALSAATHTQRGTTFSANEAQSERIAYEEQMRQSQSTPAETEATRTGVYAQCTGWSDEACSCPRCVRARAESEYYATYSGEELNGNMRHTEEGEEKEEVEGSNNTTVNNNTGAVPMSMINRDESKMASRAGRCCVQQQHNCNNTNTMNAGCMWQAAYKAMPYGPANNNNSALYTGANGTAMYNTCACPHCNNNHNNGMVSPASTAAMTSGAGMGGIYDPACCYANMSAAAAAMGGAGAGGYYGVMNPSCAAMTSAGNGMPMWMPGAGHTMAAQLGVMGGAMAYIPGSAAPRTRQTLLKSLGEVPVMSVKAHTRSSTTNSTRPPSTQAVMARSTTEDSLPEDVITTDTLTSATTHTASGDSTADEAEYTSGRRVMSLGSVRSTAGEQQQQRLEENRPEHRLSYQSRMNTLTSTPATSMSSFTSLSMANSYGAAVSGHQQSAMMPRVQSGNMMPGLNSNRPDSFASATVLSGKSSTLTSATTGIRNTRLCSATLPTSTTPAAAVGPVSPTELLCVELMQGRIVELACTATGKAQLQAVLHSHPGLVLDVCVRELSLAMDRVALDSQGCHVLRAVVELCDAAQTQQIVATLHEELIIGMCTVSQYTRRVIQSLFERALVDLSFLVDVIARNGFYLAATQQGCIAFMRVYERCNREQQALLMEPLASHLAELALDPLGNYVVQCAMEQSEKTVAAQLAVGCFTGRLLAMSCDKFASNVMEKVARCCGDVPAVRRLLMDELVYNPVSLQEVINDGYGNFVLQALIECVTQPMEFKRMCDRLKPVLPNSPFAAKIETKLKQRQRIIGAVEQVSFSRRRNSAGHQANKSAAAANKGQNGRSNQSQQQQRNSNARSSPSATSSSS